MLHLTSMWLFYSHKFIGGEGNIFQMNQYDIVSIY